MSIYGSLMDIYDQPQREAQKHLCTFLTIPSAKRKYIYGNLWLIDGHL